MKNTLKQDWDLTRERLSAWWRHEGLAVCVMAPSDRPAVDVPPPPPPSSPEERWLDSAYRAKETEYSLSNTFFGGEAFPYFDSSLGPGNLATFLGSEPVYEYDTVWFNPCIHDPDDHPPLVFDPDNYHFKTQLRIIEDGLKAADQRYLVGMPDLIENVDILASLRGTQGLLTDLVDRPGFVKERISEINQVFFQAFDAIYSLIKDDWNGNVSSFFRFWGPGKTSKVQCDSCGMFSPRMFRELVVPGLTEQCAWLDYSAYHLDGTQCVMQLDNLLAIEELDAIEWTAQSGQPDGLDPCWYDLFRRILRAGKSVQAIGGTVQDIVPLLDAVGPKGMYIWTGASSEAEAAAILQKIEPYYRG